VEEGDPPGSEVVENVTVMARKSINKMKYGILQFLADVSNQKRSP
jgi:hypothetical protein